MMVAIKADEAAVAIAALPQQIMNTNHQQTPRQPTTTAATEEFYDPLPYRRSNSGSHQSRLQEQQKHHSFQNQQNLCYAQLQGTNHQGAAALPWQSQMQPGASKSHRNLTTTTTTATNHNAITVGPLMIEQPPIWTNANAVTTSNRNNNTVKEPPPSSIADEDDSNPIPIQPRYHPSLRPFQKRKNHFELGQSSSGLHIPKQQQQWGTFPIQTAAAAQPVPRIGPLRESKMDLFQGRRFYPPHHQQQQQQQQMQQVVPQQQHPLQPPNANFFHHPEAQFHQTQSKILPSRGTTPIPTSFVHQNQCVPKSSQTRICTNEKASLEQITKTRKRPWHRRTFPSRSGVHSHNTDEKRLGTLWTFANSNLAKIHTMLEDAPTKRFDHIVSWQSHGRAFKIHKPFEFSKQVLPLYFDTEKITSFQRWLRAWGFCRHREGADKDAFYHRYFIRGVVVSLVSGLSRNEMFESMKGWIGPGEIPDFCLGNTNVKPDELNDNGDQNYIHKSESHHPNPRRLRGTLLETVRQMLDDSLEKNFDHIVSWLPGGRAFKIHDTVGFVEQVCGTYFQTKLLRSFSDSLRTWGFCRLWEASGIEVNAYYHRLFEQGKPHLCRDYSRKQMLIAMKDFREEQKFQQEISWALFPRHREEHQKQQHQESIHNELSNAPKVGNNGLVEAGNDLSDDEDIGGEVCAQEPLDIDEAVIPTPIPQPQDYFIPYLNLQNTNSTSTGKNGNDGSSSNNNSNVEMDNSMHPHYGENYGLDTCYQIMPPGTIANTNREERKPCDEIKSEPKLPKKSNPKSIHHITSLNNRETGMSYVIRISIMLESVEKNGKHNIVSWRSHGRAFKIHDEKTFESEILPRYFSATSLASFHRWLNKWGFLRVRSGMDRRCWYHRLFVRGVVDLLKGFTQRQMFDSMEEWRVPGKEPHFYCFGQDYELSELSVSKNPNKKQKIEEESTESIDQSNDTDWNPEKASPTIASKQEAIVSQLLQPQSDPKSLRGTLVEKLREMLDAVRLEGNADVVSWLPHGKAFKIHNKKVFKETILHRFFGVSKYRYFGDGLRSWGFVIFKNGKDKGAFYHKCFLRNKPRLSLHLSRSQLKASMKDWQKKMAAPDFYKELEEDQRDDKYSSFPVPTPNTAL